MAQGIDFMAIARGRQQALDDNYRDIVRLQEQERYAFEREKRMAEREQNQFNRIATTYTAPWMLNIQQLTKSGLSEVDAYLQNLSTVQTDPNFQAMPLEAQAKVLEQIQNFAVPITQRLAAAGDVAGIQKLSSGLGVTTPINPLAAAINSGDIDAIITAAGYEVTPGSDAVNVGGQMVPKSMLAARLAQTGQRAGALEAAEQARIDLVNRGQIDQQRASQRAAIEAQYVFAGFVKQPDGTLLQPTTGNRIRIDEQNNAVLAPQPTVPGLTGEVGLNTVLRPEGMPPAQPTPEATAIAQAAGGPAINPIAALAPFSPAVAAGANIGQTLQQRGLGGVQGMATDGIEAAASLINRTTGGAATKLDEMRATAAPLPPSLAMFTRLQTANDIAAGQSDASAAVYARNVPRKELMMRLQAALAAASTPVEKARIQLAIDRFRRVK